MILSITCKVRKALHSERNSTQDYLFYREMENKKQDAIARKKIKIDG